MKNHFKRIVSAAITERKFLMSKWLKKSKILFTIFLKNIVLLPFVHIGLDVLIKQQFERKPLD